MRRPGFELSCSWLGRRAADTILQRQTVGELPDEWLAVVSHRLAPPMLAAYGRIMEHRRRPQLGATKLAELRPAHIARALSAARQPGGNRRGRTSPPCPAC